MRLSYIFLFALFFTILLIGTVKYSDKIKTFDRYEKVVIDSISVRLKYNFTIDSVWCYHTKYGPTIYSMSPNFNVGDTILVKIVSHEQANNQ